MKTCYIVQGTTGEYSDRDEWTVRVFCDEAKARQFTEALLESVRGSRGWDHDDRYKFKHPLDPNCRVDYTGVDYTYFKAELDDEQ